MDIEGLLKMYANTGSSGINTKNVENKLFQGIETGK
jgi:hypothetical protein